MAENKKSVLLYCDIIHTVEKLNNEEAGMLFKHYLKYINDLNPIPQNQLIEIIFEPIKQNLKRDLKKWEEKRKRNSLIAKEGWEKRKYANASERMGMYAKNADIDNVIDIDKDIKENIYGSFLKRFNQEVGKKYRGDEKSKRQLNARLKSGYSEDDIISALINAKKQQNHIDSKFKYLTPEFITRQDKLEYFINIEPINIPKQELKKPETIDSFTWNQMDYSQQNQAIIDFYAKKQGI